MPFEINVFSPHPTIKNIVNANNFNLMIPAKVKDSLVELLPDCDTKSHESVTEMFTNPEFLHSLLLFQRHLYSGTFDTSDSSNLRKVRRVQVAPWKVCCLFFFLISKT